MKKKTMPIIALVLIAGIMIVGGTIAYFTSGADFLNIFQTKKYNTELTEIFKSPENWTPGTTTEKLVQVKNTGDIPLVARVSLTEEWVPIEGENLSTTLKDGRRVVELNGIDLSKWAISEEGPNKTMYYYYNSIIEPGSDTVTFMNSVTLNENVEIEYDETIIYTYASKEDRSDAIEITVKNGEEMTEADKAAIEGKKKVKQVKRYASKKDGYAGATYTLTIKLETVQADRYKEVWGTDIEII